MPGGNSTSRPYNRSEKQASSRRKQRLDLGRKILNEATKGNIDRDTAEREMKNLFKTEAHKRDTKTVFDAENKETDRKIGKKYMLDKSTPKDTKGTRKPSKYNKGGYCGASNPASRPVKTGK